MIVKHLVIDEGKIEEQSVAIYTDIERVFKEKDAEGNKVLYIKPKNGDDLLTIPLNVASYKSEDNTTKSIYSQVYLMTDEGKTIERLV